ncbi:MAG: VWA domain-containing protein [bacterium]|nr:VWA domain-containing protein [bacterium]
MQRFVPLAFFAALVLGSASAQVLVPRGGGSPIAVRSQHVDATLEDGLARTKVRHTFVNPGDRPLEAIYTFPLPAGAALTQVAMEVGGERHEGLLAERKRARRVYDDIVRRKRDPALVEQVGRNTFRLSVFPVVPHEETVVELAWIQRVPLTEGAFRYVYPLGTTDRAQRAEQDLSITVRVRSAVPLTEVSASHDDVQVVRRGPHEALAALETRGGNVDRDFVVTAAVATQEPNLAVRTYRGESGDGWFLAVVTPPRARPDQLVPRDVTLVIDTSGSMAEDGKIEQAKASAAWLLDHLRPADRVNVLRFSSDVQAFAPAPVAATEENLAQLRQFVAGFRATGSTALGDALRIATEVPAEAAPARGGRADPDEVEEEAIVEDFEVLDVNEESEPDALADSPFDDRAFNDVIGIGGGAGGKFGGRFGGRRNLRAAGGSGTEQALKDQFEWMMDQQDPDGHWDSDGSAEHDVRATAMALLALLGDGNTIREGPYKANVVRGVKWLRGQQDFTTGGIGVDAGPGSLRDHALASLVFAEVYFFSKSPLVKASAQRALDFLVASRDPRGGWSAGAGASRADDLQLTAWALLALFSGKEGGLAVDDATLAGAVRWIDTSSDASPDQAPGASLLCRILSGQKPNQTPALSVLADVILASASVIDGGVESLGPDEWFFRTSAMYQMGGRHWKAWNKVMKRALLELQRKDADARGSWVPMGENPTRGRVETTATMGLCLEVYYRFSRVIGAR